VVQDGRSFLRVAHEVKRLLQALPAIRKHGMYLHAPVMCPSLTKEHWAEIYSKVDSLGVLKVRLYVVDEENDDSGEPG